MAGLGHKIWTQETVSVANFQGYLQDQTVEKFASAAARTTALASPAEGQVCYLADVDRLEWYNGTAWSPVQGRGGLRYTSPGTTVASGGANETGITGGIVALASFTLYRPAWVDAVFTFRASGAGAALCTCKIDGAQVGDQVLSRYDIHVTGTGGVSLAAGVHTVGARVDAVGGSVTWTTALITLRELAAGL